MVYCNYISNTDTTVTYAFGALVSDITGIIVFDFQNDVIEIVQPPNKRMPMERHIGSLYGMHQKAFKSGTFKDKISYEI